MKKTTLMLISEAIDNRRSQLADKSVIQFDRRNKVMRGVPLMQKMYISALYEGVIDIRGLDKSAKEFIERHADNLRGSVFTDRFGQRCYLWREGRQLYYKTLTEWMTPNRSTMVAGAFNHTCARNINGDVVVFSHRISNIAPWYCQ